MPVSGRESEPGYASWPPVRGSNRAVVHLPSLLDPPVVVVGNQIVPRDHRKGDESHRTDLNFHTPLHRDMVAVETVAAADVHTEAWEFPWSRRGGWACTGCCCYPSAVGELY